MASEQECREAIEVLIERLGAVDESARRKHLPDRSIGVTLLDHDCTYVGDLKSGELINVRREAGDFKPQVRVVCTSDDLIALTEGRLRFAHAWATGQVRLDASLRDLLRLRALA
jgi:putative sterol carrier protein